MANVERIKRQLLRDLVQENLDLIAGRRSRRPRRGGGRRLASRVAAFALFSLGLLGLGSSRVLPNLAALPRSPAARPARDARPAAAALAPVAGAEVLAAARTIDAAVFPLAVRRVVIDPGHGGASLGTRTSLGLLEKDLTLDIAERLRRLLAARSLEVVMTRGGDVGVSLSQRTALANRAGGDIFVSIHVNWIENRAARGVETYYLGPTDDPFLSRLAAAENRESGYSLADMRQLLDRIYAGVRQDKSRKLAEVTQTALFGSLRKVNPRLEDRGVKSAPFLVLLNTQMPAILAEVSCLSNEEEARLLAQPLYRQYIAQALSEGIRSYAEVVEGAGEKGT
jgi:N-acetylmuramoyl-L-alanine amidase